ncbi:MAG: hypothetical protein RL582_754 [Bacteroidota bacterium]
MNKLFIGFLFFLFSQMSASGQLVLKMVVQDGKTNQRVGDVIVSIDSPLNDTCKTDNLGTVIIKNFPQGKILMQVSKDGYETYRGSVEIKMEQQDTIYVLLMPKQEEDEMDEVVISSTRSSRSIRDIPNRIEVIAGEELEEKANMKSGDIRMILSESTGIQIQQTSPTSANASIRIQGLDGRYTQVLKDGFPLYAGAASGLGLLQTPPLDLKQVEVIKGSSSTLYGGGAIAGLVNLISKVPTEEGELKFHINGSSGRGFDINGFYGKQNKKLGTTIFSSHHRNWAYDPSNTGFSAIPKFERYVLNPKIFMEFNEKTKLVFGVNTVWENRTGGDVRFIEGKGDSTNLFFEQNKTNRFSTQLSLDHKLKSGDLIQFKNSVGYFNREIRIPQYSFEGTQTSTFSEISHTRKREKLEWISGMNLWTENFIETKTVNFLLRNYSQVTAGAFIQNVWKMNRMIQIESGMRTDYALEYGVAFLPRIAALFTFSNQFTSRIGGGFGYKTPTLFTEESERVQYQNVSPIDPKVNQIERSYGANIDFNYRTKIREKIKFSINQLFFYTQINRPLLLQKQSDTLYKFINSNGKLHTAGAETNVKIEYEDFKLFLGYTFTNTNIDQNGNKVEAPLTPKHRINSVLMYEVEDKWKLGLEAYYFDKQKLNDGKTGKAYWLCGFMAEKLWEQFSVYINFENFLDSRQTRFDNIYTGTISNPVFRDIYAPLDGFLINAGIKLKL